MSGKGKPRPDYGVKRSTMSTGYIRVWAPEHPLAAKDGYVLEHRKVVFDAGIAVPAGYVVHHKNHRRADNRLENLVVMPRGAHQREHLVKDGVQNQWGTFRHDPTSYLERQRALTRRNDARRRAGYCYDKASGTWRHVDTGEVLQ